MRSLDVARDGVTVRDVVRVLVLVTVLDRVNVALRERERDDVRDFDAENEGELVWDDVTDAVGVREYVRGVPVCVVEYEAGGVPVAVTDGVGEWDLKVVRVAV